MCLENMTMLQRSRFMFQSGPTECCGYLTQPRPSRHPAPCVVMAHGFGGTQDGSLAATVADFARAGLAAFTFDCRGFGESGGEPRQLISIRDQLEDWHAAIAHARSLPTIDPSRIAIWGSSLGGAHVVYVPAMGRLGEPAVMVLQGADAIMISLQNSTWRNEVAPRIILDLLLWYRPDRRAHLRKMPILVCLAEQDRHTAAALSRKIADHAPLGELRRYPCTHFDFYTDPVRRVVAADQLSFLRTQLLGLHPIESSKQAEA